jgi:hypothetical protein
VIHTEEDYPHEHANLPAVKQLLAHLDWEVVCVFDACRWDAFEQLCAPAEPVASPGPHTPAWTVDLWCDSEYDWSDVTYISASPMPVHVRELDRFPDAIIEDHVGDYVAAYEREDLFSEYIQVVLPGRLTEYAATCEPPMVVHYVQPHAPFIAPEVGIKVSFNVFDDLVLDVSPSSAPEDPVYRLWRDGHVSTELLRTAYRQNLELVWQESEQLREQFDRVVTTADHGELLGPDSFGHPDRSADRLRVVPFHTSWDPPRPDPADAGAVPTHDWMYDSFGQSEERPRESDGEERNADAAEKRLGDLGYR